MSYDLIIVGGGIAGLSAAVRSIEQGLKPLILEKGDEPNYPCNARYSGGVVHVQEEIKCPLRRLNVVGLKPL